MRLAQLDRAFGYGPKGREFESSNARAKPVLIVISKQVFCDIGKNFYIFIFQNASQNARLFKDDSSHLFCASNNDWFSV